MWEIFKTFFKIGMFTFGGGYAMIPLIEEQVVKEKQWINEVEFLELLSVAQGLPGAMAINLANFIGFKIKGYRGLAMACLGTVMPSFLIILTIAMLMTGFPIMTVLQPAMDGMLPAIAVLIIYSALKLSKKTPKNMLNGILFFGALVALLWFKISPIWVVLTGVVIGVIKGGLEQRGAQS